MVNSEDNRLSEAAAALSASGAQVQPVRADLATYNRVEALWSAIQTTGRPVNAVALNAGV